MIAITLILGDPAGLGSLARAYPIVRDGLPNTGAAGGEHGEILIGQDRVLPPSGQAPPHYNSRNSGGRARSH